MITKVLDEAHAHTWDIVLERNSAFNGGRFVVKTHRHYTTEDEARAAFEAERHRGNRRKKKGVDNDG